jgi:hypothetical protein
MSKIESIVIQLGTARVYRNGVEIPLRIAQRLDDLACALEAQMCVPASVRETLQASPDGTVVICDSDTLEPLVEGNHAAMPWVVVIDESPKAALRRAEALDLAAVVVVDDYEDWVDSPKYPAALFGRKDVADRIGATTGTQESRLSRSCPRILLEGPRYARMTRAGELPTLLADYLADYAELYLKG